MARIRLVLLFVCLMSPLIALSAFAEGGVKAKYDFEMTLLTESQAVYVRQNVHITNETGARLGRAVFSVYANSFRRESTLNYDNATLEKAFPDYYAPSGIDIIQITVNGESTDWGVQGESESFLRVECDLQAGEEADIYFEYTLLLSDNHAFLGAGDYDWRLYAFYPSLCPYQNGDYVTNALTRAGRSLFADASDFDAVMILPADYAIACAGVISNTDLQNDSHAYTISTKNARDLTLCVSRKYHEYERETVSGVVIRVFGRDRQFSKRVLAAAEYAIDKYTELLGAYPKNEIVLAQSQSCAEDICGSGISILGEDAPDLGVDELRLLIYNVIAKQYLTDVVHPNPSYDAWLTDGLCEYMSLMLSYERDGKNEFLKNMNARVAPSLSFTLPGGLYANSDVGRISTVTDYNAVVRFQGAAVLDELRRVMGRDAFLQAVSDYYQNNIFSKPNANDFIDALNGNHATELGDALVSHIYLIDTDAWENFEYTE